MDSRDFIKGTLKPIVLKLLSVHARLYGYQITQLVRELTSGSIQLTEGALYPALHQLVDEGILRTEEEFTGNRKRVYYSLTDYGKVAAQGRLQDFVEFIFLMSKLFIGSPEKAL